MRKLLSAVLALAMAGAVMATPAFAEENVFTISPNGDGDYCISGVKPESTLSDAVENNILVFPDEIEGHPIVFIGSGAFRNKTIESVSSVRFPQGIKVIERNAFQNFGRIEQVTIPASVWLINNSAFEGADVGSISIEQNDQVATLFYTDVKEASFRDCTMEEITLPGTVSQIGTDAFKNCLNLKKVNFSGSVEQWNGLMSSNTGEGNEILTQHYIPVVCTDGTVEGYHDGTTGHTWDSGTITKQPSITEDGEKTYHCDCGMTYTERIASLSEDVLLFEYSGDGSYVRITGVKEGASLDSLVDNGTLYLPDSINGSLVTMIWIDAFQNQTVEGASSIQFPSSLRWIGNNAFANFKVTQNQKPVTLNEIVLPEVQGMGVNVFYGVKVKTLDLSHTEIKYVSPSLVGDCTELETVKLPVMLGDVSAGEIGNIGENAFKNCTSLETIEYKGTKEQWNTLTIYPNGNELLTNHCVDVSCSDGTITATHDEQQETVTQEATCGQAGVKITTCKVCNTTLKTEEIPATGNHQWNEWVVTTEPTMQTEGLMTRTCAVCGATETKNVPKQEKYTVMNGAGQTAEKGGTATFRFSIPFFHFKELRIDGVVVPDTQYTKWQGSTYVRLNAGYVSALSNGTHTVTAVDLSGRTVSASFTVAEAAQQPAQRDEHPEIAEARKNGTWGAEEAKPSATAAVSTATAAAKRSSIPQTGDAGGDRLMVAAVLLVLSALGLAGVVVLRRSRKSSKQTR